MVHKTLWLLLKFSRLNFRGCFTLSVFKLSKFFWPFLLCPVFIPVLKVFALGKYQWAHQFSTGKMKTELVLQGLI